MSVVSFISYSGGHIPDQIVLLNDDEGFSYSIKKIDNSQDIDKIEK